MVIPFNPSFSQPQPRVLYRRNPLAEVSATLHFETTQLELTELSAPFHAAIRKHFPVYAGVEEEYDLKGHAFLSRDRLWRASLTPQVLRCSTRRYERWEELHERWACLEAALWASHQRLDDELPVSLEYVDVLSRSALGLHDTPWSELLNAELLGIVAAAPAGWLLRETYQTIHYTLPDKIELTLTHGLYALSDEEPRYVIQTLLATRTRDRSTEEAFVRLRAYTSRIFRACISDRLHEALEPELLESPPA